MRVTKEKKKGFGGSEECDSEEEKDSMAAEGSSGLNIAYLQMLEEGQVQEPKDKRKNRSESAKENSVVIYWMTNRLGLLRP